MKYPGVAIGARGKTVPVGSYYGEPTRHRRPAPVPESGVRRERQEEMGLRALLSRPRLLLLERSRQTVSRRHVVRASATSDRIPSSRRPIPKIPRWENLSSNVGAQYFWVDRIFNWQGDDNKKSFFYQLFHTSRPGTLDTSLVSTDNINNPRTMNAVYYLGPRMAQAKKWGKETLAGGGLNNRQFNDFVPASDPLAQFFQAPSTDLDPARPQGRLRFGRRARRAEPRLPQHRPVQRGMAASLHAAHRRHSRSRRSRSPSRGKTRPIGARRNCRRRTWRGSSSQHGSRTI